MLQLNFFETQNFIFFDDIVFIKKGRTYLIICLFKPDSGCLTYMLKVYMYYAILYIHKIMRTHNHTQHIYVIFS